MNIGFLLPATFAVTHAGNGVRAQAMAQAQALRALGHTVIELDGWKAFGEQTCEVVQFFSGGFPHYRIDEVLRATQPDCKLVFAPIIDSNEPPWRYRLAARLGQCHPKIFTIPGELARQARAADVVVCRSRHEQRRVVDDLGVPVARTRIVLNGVDAPNPTLDLETVRRQWSLPEDFCLHVSTYTQPRKNVARLIEAAGAAGLPLLVAGTADDAAEEARLRALAARHRGIRFLGYVDAASRDALYALARVFCLPSLHEGTGLAALEAAAHGAAVVITERGGTRDYFGEMAHYVHAEHVDSIRTAIEQAWHAPRSNALRDHVVNQLGWQQSARALLDAYR